MASSEGNRNVKPAAALPEIPDKLYFRIGEVARLLDLPTYVLRFWETEFPQLKPGKGGTGQRLYRRRDVDLALRIRTLLYEEGYTIPGARQLLKSEARPKEAPTEVVEEPVPELPGAAIRLRRMRSELREISSLLARPPAPGTLRAASPAHPNPAHPNPAHRGLHMAGRKRPPVAPIRSLFPVEGSEEE